MWWSDTFRIWLANTLLGDSLVIDACLCGENTLHIERFNQIYLSKCDLCHPKETPCQKRKKSTEAFLRLTSPPPLNLDGRTDRRTTALEKIRCLSAGGATNSCNIHQCQKRYSTSMTLCSYLLSFEKMFETWQTGGGGGGFSIWLKWVILLWPRYFVVS